jgi:glucose-6-phosphate 1-dehydrogenase
MNFRYDLAFAIPYPPSAYEWLLHDAMQGDQTLFPRSDWIYQAWSIVDPILKYWEAKTAPDLTIYPAGTWGPKLAEALLTRDGWVWHNV